MEPEALTLRHFMVHTVAGELLNVDGALWRTLRLLFVRPGRLSLEYDRGAVGRGGRGARAGLVTRRARAGARHRSIRPDEYGSFIEHVAEAVR